MHRTALSVLMSVKNGNPLVVQRAIDSVLDQTFADFEFLIMDDGSDDADVIALLDSAAKKDRRVRIISQENQGLTVSLNTLLSLASAPLCARMDADDVSLPNRFERQTGILNNHANVGIVGCWVSFKTASGSNVRLWKLPDSSSYIKAELTRGNPLVHSSIIFRKKVIQSLGGYDVRIKASQDYELWRRCSAYTDFSIAQEVLHEQYLSPGTVTMVKTAEQRKTNWLIKEAYGANLSGEQPHLEIAMQKYSENKERYDRLFNEQAESYRATVWAMTGHPFLGMLHVINGLRINPFNYKLLLKCGLVWYYAFAYHLKNRFPGKNI